MTLTELSKVASSEFDTFVDMIHDDYPELLLKYQINKDMKSDFIEAMMRQVWIQKSYNKIDILEFMVTRGKR